MILRDVQSSVVRNKDHCRAKTSDFIINYLLKQCEDILGCFDFGNFPPRIFALKIFFLDILRV